MQHQNIEDSEYCLNCGIPLLFSDKPCPTCTKESSLDRTSNPKVLKNIIKICFLVPVISLFAYLVINTGIINLITFIKLQWFILMHPVKWIPCLFSIPLIIWDALIYMEFSVSFFILAKIFEYLYSLNIERVKRILYPIGFAILLPIIFMVIGVIERSVFAYASPFDTDEKITITSGIQDNYIHFITKLTFNTPDEIFKKQENQNYYSYLTSKEQALEKLKPSFWLTYYPNLIELVQDSRNGTVQVLYTNTYRHPTKITFLNDNGLVIKLESTDSTLYTKDKNGTHHSLDEKGILYIRDENFDGYPDSIKSQTIFNKKNIKKKSQDAGYRKYTKINTTNKINQQNLVDYWNYCIGYSILYFLNHKA